jgi:hypothetical protein
MEPLSEHRAIARVRGAALGGNSNLAARKCSNRARVRFRYVDEKKSSRAFMAKTEERKADGRVK